MRRWLSTLLLLMTSTAFVGPGASAQPPAEPQPTAAEARQVRSVVEAQLKALAADDAPAAFALAAPGIREMFVSPDKFIAMVRNGYPVVYRPASVAFLKPEKLGPGQMLQAVHLTDAEGSLWVALYHLQRQPDKTWRISGCEVAPAQGRVA